MKRNLLLAIMCAGAVGMSANAQEKVSQMQASATSVVGNEVTAPVKMQPTKYVVKTDRMSSKASIQICKTADGSTFKRLSSPLKANLTVNPAMAKTAKTPQRAEQEGASQISEGFEGYPGDNIDWMPDGWSTQSLVELEEPNKWGITATSMMLPPLSGQYAMGINFNINTVDEWLVTPEVTLEGESVLTFLSYIDPAFLFNMNYVDWDLFEFTEKHPSATLQIMVKIKGEEEWTMVKDFYNDYVDYSLEELLYMTPTELELKSIPLTDFAGKTIQIGFRYTGTDGNTILIDDVFVGQPPLEVSYMWPMGTLYTGVSADFSASNYSIPVLPAYTPLTWMNTTSVDEASYTWLYHSSLTNDLDFTNETDLTETYYPDYTSEFTTRNNLYYTPMLTGSAPGYSESSVTHYDYFQVGGKPEWSYTDGIVNHGFSVFDYQTEGFAIAGVDNDDQASTPIYGYDPFVDKFWTDYTFQGDNAEGDGVKMTAIFNYFFAPESPIVINGVWALGKGQVGENAEFTIDIIPLTDEGIMDEPLATAKCNGSQMTLIEGGVQNFISIPFAFENPVVMSNEVCGMYIVRLSGFNDPENVTYFAPFQSTIDNPFEMALGWVEKEITNEGATRTSVTPTAYYTGYHAFSINLDAHYPWLETADENTESVLICTSPVELPLSSYYDGADIKVTTADGGQLPEWLNVAVSGRYGEAKATFTGTGEGTKTCDILLSAPGVSKALTVNFNSDPSGIEDIIGDDSEITEVYNISGQRVNNIKSLEPGLYIVRYASGKTAKIAVK